MTVSNQNWQVDLETDNFKLSENVALVHDSSQLSPIPEKTGEIGLLLHHKDVQGIL